MDESRVNTIALRHLKHSSIKDVINQMGELQLRFEKDSTLFTLKSFLLVYSKVTQKVYEYSSRGKFKNTSTLELLDIHFANLYFKPINQYLLTSKISTPWLSYIKYSQSKLDPFILMLLGINAHINSDLLQTLIDTDYDEYDDFMLVNEILLETIPEIMSYLAFQEFDIWGIGGLIFSDFAKYEFRQTIVKWRNEVWENYQKIKKNNLQNTYLQKTQHETELIAESIVHIFHTLEHFNNIRESFDELNTLKINI